MERRKTLSIILSALMLGILSGSPAMAKTVKQPYLAEQAKGKAPNVTVYMTGSKMAADVHVSGQIDSLAFQQNGDIVPFEQSAEGLHYVILFDNSGSVDEKQFRESKKQLASLCNSLKAKDLFTLYTVGSYSGGGEKQKVAVNLKGSDKKKRKKVLKQISKIKYLKSKKSKTVLYRSLNEVLAEQQGNGSRTVILMITDGEDDSRGKDIDRKSTADEVKNAGIPVYGILLHNVSAKPDKAKRDYTQYKILNEKNCRGYYEDCSHSSSAKQVKKAFQTMQRLLRKETYVVPLRAATNQTVGKAALQLTLNQQGIDSVSIDYSDYEQDSNAPVIAGTVKKISNSSIRFSLQDDNGINTEDSNQASHYIVQTKTEKEDGEIWNIKEVSTRSSGNELEITLTLAEELYNGRYVLICNDIRDNSQDANAMSGAVVDFEVEDGLNRSAVERKEFVKSYWWIALIVLVALLGIIIVIVIKKKSGRMDGINPAELHQSDSKLIRLTITDRSGVIKDVEWNVEGSFFVGRSRICNLDFDDDRLSKQHFVIEVTRMGCYIEDLESTNGTFVNGVKMTTRRMLLDGDVITAGREKFVFHLPKNPALGAG